MSAPVRPPAAEGLPSDDVAPGRRAGTGSDPCAACGEPLRGAFCHTCGERRPRPGDESLGHVLREQVQEATSADGRLWRSLRGLFVPGRLTAEYFAGRRSRYVRPVRLFLILNVTLFFALSFLQRNPLQGQLRTQLDALGEPAVEATQARLEAWGGEERTFVALYDRHATTLSSSLLIVLVPVLAVLFVVAFGRQSGARHLVFATHAVSAMIGVYLLVLAFALAAVVLGRVFGVEEAVLGPWLNLPLAALLLGAITAYLALGARRVYGVGRARSWAGGLAVAVGGVVPLLIAYRTALFWLTLWTLDLPAP